MFKNIKETVKEFAKDLAWRSVYIGSDQIVRSVVANRVKNLFGIKDKDVDGIQTK